MQILDRKVCVVTGALGLLGREHCRALAAAGAHVVATDVDESACRTFADALGDDHDRSMLGVGADVTDGESVRRLLNVVKSRYDRVDALVNNAAINDKVEDPSPDATRFETYPVETFRKVMDVNVTGTFLTCQVIGTDMAERGGGSIVNVASTYGVVAPDQGLYVRPDGTRLLWKTAAYPTSKGAVLQLTRFLAGYWGPRGVRVNALSPGGVRTDGTAPDFVERYARRTMLGRMAEPTDYHGALVFLASEASAYMTGANLLVDGGWTAW